MQVMLGQWGKAHRVNSFLRFGPAAISGVLYNTPATYDSFESSYLLLMVVKMAGKCEEELSVLVTPRSYVHHYLTGANHSWPMASLAVRRSW